MTEDLKPTTPEERAARAEKLRLWKDASSSTSVIENIEFEERLICDIERRDEQIGEAIVYIRRKCVGSGGPGKPDDIMTAAVEIVRLVETLDESIAHTKEERDFARTEAAKVLGLTCDRTELKAALARAREANALCDVIFNDICSHLQPGLSEEDRKFLRDYQCSGILSAIDQLRHDLARAREDTARLDWLVEHEKPCLVDGSPEGLVSAIAHHIEVPLREAIDAAMREKGGEPTAHSL